ncbi:MAG: hypothetical protein NE330_17070 [Lentisphaeraceae bacterium]|nr:hypothetical protein [Lentisphaeraceae bacterium]
MKGLISLFLFIALSFSAAAVENDKYIPATCNTLMGFNIEKIVTIPALKEVLKDENNKELKEMRSFGLAPEEMSSILIGMNSEAAAANPTEFDKDPEVIIIAKMKTPVDTKKIIEGAKKEKVEIKEVSYKKTPVTLMKKDGKTMAMTKLGDNLLAIGGTKMIKRAILLKTGASTENVSSKSHLMKNIKNDKMIWAVGTLPPMPKPGPNEPMANPAAGAAEQIKGFAVDGDYEKEATLNVSLMCKSDQGAAQLSAMAQLFIGMATSSPESPLKPDALKMSTEGANILFTLKLDQETLDKMTKMATQGGLPGGI